MAEIWGALVIGGAGLALTAKGQMDQKKANKKANRLNTQNQDETNRISWSNYLMTRGIAPTGNVTPGQLPQPGQFKAVNSKLPLWMTLPANVGRS